MGKRFIIWLTGLSAAGKTTIAKALWTKIENSVILDGDEVRKGLCSDLGMSPDDRAENVRRAGELAILLAKQSLIAIVAFTSPNRSVRDRVRWRADKEGVGFLEVWVCAELEVCKERDYKGIYKFKSNVVGVDIPYEPPTDPRAFLVRSDKMGVWECVSAILGAMKCLATSRC